MNKLAVWSIVALCGLLLAAGCAGPEGRGKLKLDEGLLAKRGLKVFWQAALPLDDKTGEKVLRVYRREGRVYALTSDNRLLAADAFSGHFLWSARLEPADLKPTGIDQFGNIVYVAVVNQLYGFSAEDGLCVLKRELHRAPSTRPVVNGPFVYFGTGEGWFCAEGLTDRAATWSRQTMASVVAAPVFDESCVYFANTDGRVFASNYRANRTAWEFQTRGAVVADLKRTAGGLILVASRDYLLYALNASSGLVAWQTPTGDPLEKTPRPVGDRIYVIKKGGDLLALDERTGQIVWTAKSMEDFVAASPETLFMLNTAGRIAALSPADGSVKYTLGLGRLKLAAVNEIDGQLFLASSEGQVVALREVKVNY